MTVDSVAVDHAVRTERTAELVDKLHEIVSELEALHPGRPFPLDGHIVGSIGEAAAEAIFAITLRAPSTSGHDAVADDGRTVEIKATYGTSGVGLRGTSHDAAHALIVLRLSKTAGVQHEIIFNGPLAVALEAAGPLQKNGQAMMSLARLRGLNEDVPTTDRVRFR